MQAFGQGGGQRWAGQAAVAADDDSAFAFGQRSAAEGDLASSQDERQRLQAQHRIDQASLGREVNPKVFSTPESTERAASEPFLRDVLAKPKIFLIGNAHDLEELVGSQP